MNALKWHEQTVLAIDTETSGVNPLEARVVTAAAVYMTPGQRPRTITWLIDPQVEVPAEAAEVHGWTNDRIAQTVGKPGGYAIRNNNGTRMRIPAEAAHAEIAGHIGSTIGRDQGVIVHNAAYDLTLIETELARHGIDTLASRPRGIYGVVDPMVIEKAYDPYRKVRGGCRGGKVRCGGCGVEDKTLESLCRHYGVVHAGAHGADTDAVAAVRLLGKLLAAWPDVARWKLGTLHEHQVKWRRDQSDSLRSFWRREGDERWREVDSSWPVHSSLTSGAGEPVAPMGVPA